MPKFLLEVPHEGEKIACIRAIQILFETGSHYLTNADFGCLDGVHKAWLIIDVDTKEEARMILPPAYRESATIVQLNKFTPEELERLLEHHNGE